jgi:O-antigen/teichoic acid export membrane protein
LQLAMPIISRRLVASAHSLVGLPPSLRGRFAKAAVWSFIGAALSRGLTLVSSVICARLLTKTGFGELGMIQSTVGMFSIVAGLGLGMTATKYVAEHRTDDPRKAGRLLALTSAVAVISGAVMSIALILLAPLLSEKSLVAPRLAGPLALAAGMLFFGAVNGAQTGALSGFEAFKTIARVNLSSGLLSFPLVVVGVWRWGLNGAVAGLVLSVAVNCLLNNLAIRKECAAADVPYVFHECWQEWPVLWRFSLPAFLSSSIQGPIMWLANTALVHQPGGYGELGVVNAAQQIRMMLFLIPSMAFAPVLPILSNLGGEQDDGDASGLVRQVTLLGCLTLFPAAVLLTAIAPWALGVYGRDFATRPQILTWAMVTLMINGIGVAVAQVIFSSGRAWIGLLVNACWAAVFLPGAYLALGPMGGTGYMMCFALGHLAMLLSVVIYLKRTLARVLGTTPVVPLLLVGATAMLVAEGVRLLPGGMWVGLGASAVTALGAAAAVGLMLRRGVHPGGASAPARQLQETEV